MNTTGWTVCKAFLQKCAPEKRKALLQSLPKSQAELLRSLPPPAGDPTKGLPSPDQELGHVHYSWLTPFLRNLPEHEIRLFLSSLSDEQVKGLKKNLLFSNHLTPLTPLAKTYLGRLLFAKISEGEEEVVPLNCIPESPMNVLLELSTRQILALIDFLGIHDLAVEMKHIIENTKLKQIYSALSQDELLYLKNLLQQKAPIAFKRMELAKWNGDKDTLRTLIHQRGLNRLAKGLFGQHESLLWFISHRLDMERGNLLMKLSVQLEHTKANEILMQQVLELIPNIQNVKL